MGFDAGCSRRRRRGGGGKRKAAAAESGPGEKVRRKAAAAAGEEGGARYFGYSLRTDRWRYTEWGEDGRLGRELYDHAKDPRELTNLADATVHATTLRELATQLRSAVKSSFPPSGKSPEVREGHWSPMLVK